MSTIVVAVSAQHITGSDLGQAMYSTDGITWTQAVLPHFSSGATGGWISVRYAPAIGTFCAVANGGNDNNNNTAVSTDGINWSGGIGLSAGVQALNDVCWSPTLNLFCAVASNGTTAQQIITSPDGRNWTARTSPQANTWKGICWSETKHLFVAVADTGVNQVMTSPDGITWTAQTHSLAGCLTVAWDAAIGKFCATGPSGSVQNSADGITWATTSAIANINNGTIWRIKSKKDQGLFAVAEHNGWVSWSSDGTTWSKTTGVNGAFVDNTGITWSPALGLWLCVAGQAGLSTSPDLITWTARTVNLNEKWNDIVDNYGPTIFRTGRGVIVGG